MYACDMLLAERIYVWRKKPRYLRFSDHGADAPVGEHKHGDNLRSLSRCRNRESTFYHRGTESEAWVRTESLQQRTLRARVSATVRWAAHQVGLGEKAYGRRLELNHLGRLLPSSAERTNKRE